MLSEAEVFTALRDVKDPEIRVLDVVDLGIVRGVKIENKNISVEITPTYSGCPALDVMKREIRECLSEQGFDEIEIITKLAPAWTTDWLSEEAKLKLKNYGIAPPGSADSVCGSSESLVQLPTKICCPFCESDNTKLTSEFGATACKSLWFCEQCQQPFEHFKSF